MNTFNKESTDKRENKQISKNQLAAVVALVALTSLLVSACGPSEGGADGPVTKPLFNNDNGKVGVYATFTSKNDQRVCHIDINNVGSHLLEYMVPVNPLTSDAHSQSIDILENVQFNIIDLSQQSKGYKEYGSLYPITSLKCQPQNLSNGIGSGVFIETQVKVPQMDVSTSSSINFNNITALTGKYSNSDRNTKY